MSTYSLAHRFVWIQVTHAISMDIAGPEVAVLHNPYRINRKRGSARLQPSKDVGGRKSNAQSITLLRQTLWRSVQWCRFCTAEFAVSAGACDTYSGVFRIVVCGDIILIGDLPPLPSPLLSPSPLFFFSFLSSPSPPFLPSLRSRPPKYC